METTKTFKFSNGDPVIEKVTGFKGIITGTVYYLTGCNQYLVTAKAKDEHSEAKAVWYDEGRLTLNDAEKPVRADEVEAEDNGCDMLPRVGTKGA
jgi:hypothetical protein